MVIKMAFIILPCLLWDKDIGKNKAENASTFLMFYSLLFDILFITALFMR